MRLLLLLSLSLLVLPPSGWNAAATQSARSKTASGRRSSVADFGAVGVIEGNPGQTEFGVIKLENIDVRLKDENFKVVDVKDLKVGKISVNGKPFTLKPAE